MLTIDNLDGRGAMDYSDALAPEGPLTIDRRLNEPSVCTWTLAPSVQGAPVRLGRAVAMLDDGTVVFTGYLTREPEAVYAGEASEGAVFTLRCSAMSDDWLLNKQGLSLAGESLAESGADLLTTLTSRVDASRFQNSAATAVLAVGNLRTSAAKSWSSNAGAIADAAYARYRVVDGVIELQPIGAVTHALAVTDGSLEPAGLRLGTTKDLANDVTLSGAIEPAAYVTEIFSGDGTTAVFKLSAAPFRGPTPVRAVLTDSFNQVTANGLVDPRIWRVRDTGSHLNLGSQGLVLGGGNGIDGATTMTAIDALELGGALVLEAGSVSLGPGSDGVLLGLYTGKATRPTCVAGFDVRQSNGTTTLGALIQGTATGAPLALVNGHSYTMRLRLWSPEVQRIRQTYYVMVDGTVRSFGGGTVASSLSVVLELLDRGASSNTPATVLYDGTISNGPATGSFAAVNSVQLLGAMGYVRVTQTGSAWVTSTTSSGVTRTRLIGTAGEGVDCSLSAAGELQFFSGRVPAADERITVSYRRSQRAMARVQSATSVAAESKGGLPGVAQWSGGVTAPLTRSSEDCASAANAVLAMASSRSAALAGTYKAEDLPDVWPGDLVQLGAGSPVATEIQVRRAVLTDAGSAPELVRWSLELANDWADPRSLRLSSTIAADAVLPQPVLSASSVAGLSALTVVSVTATVIQLDTGVDPPSGGGFEVRRRDGAFGPGVDQDLVLRSPTRGFSIPRAGQIEQYFVRMYDGSTPPVYSRLSSAVFTDVPVS